MLKLFVTFFLLFSGVFAKEYQLAYSQLSTPLFNAVEPISKLSNITVLNKSCNNYLLHVERVLAFSTELDTSDKEAVKEYLIQLRKLQKEYEHTLHVVNKNINLSIDENDYKKFLKLTACDIDGLLKSRTLLDKSIKYYKKNRAKKKSQYFEEKIQFLELLHKYQEQVFNQSVSDTFKSSQKSTSKKKKVYLEAKETREYIAIYVYNNNPYTISMSIDASYEELNYDKSVSKSVVLKANSKQEYIKLYKRSNPYSYSVSFRWIIGSTDAVHNDTYSYALPYKKNSSHVVSQGFNGKMTHKGSSKYAVDFAMHIGTKICASREGKVVRVKSNSNKNGVGREFSKYANYINIEHSDGTIAMYYHLKKGGVIVKVGDTVKRSQHIGYSGNTGYSTGPHLHFGVFKASSTKRTQTLPIKFISTSGIVDNPKIGIYYKAK